MSNKNKNKNGIVYSTNPNQSFSDESRSDESISIPPIQQNLRVWRDSKSRAGKTATIIKGFIGNDSELEELGKKLKTKCGVGGTVKDGDIIIQGDFKVKITQMLIDWGYQAKAAGG
ncbi:MAG: translation initiation factor [Bacteroidota bacterium]|jgi:translation initiation factor 1